MRWLWLCLVLLTVACDSKKLAPIPPDPEDAGHDAGSSGGQNGRSGAGGGAGLDEPGGMGGDGGAAYGNLHFEGTASVEFGAAGAGGDGAGGESGEGGAGGAFDPGPVLRADCAFAGDIVDVYPNDGGGWSGLVIGEVARRVEYAETGAIFEAFIAGDGHVTSDLEGNIELRIAGDQPADAKPFWLELEVLQGTETSPGRYSGAWTCAPLMLTEPGFYDVGPSISGTWELGPAE